MVLVASLALGASLRLALPLAALALDYLGDARRAEEIFEANRQVLSDPELLPIGAKLRIPRDNLLDRYLAQLAVRVAASAHLEE